MRRVLVRGTGSGRLAIAIAGLVVLTAACRSTTANITVPPTTTLVGVDLTVGDAAAGAELFMTPALGCMACHTIDGISEGKVGPDLTTIAADVAARLTDGSYTGTATDVGSYLLESLVDPNAFLAPECPAGDCNPVMIQTFGTDVAPQQLADLVAFLAERG